MKIESKKTYVEPSVIVLNVESENSFMSNNGGFEFGTDVPSGEDDDF